MSHLPTDNLARWLRELNLPEPELHYELAAEVPPFSLWLAFPDHRLGIVASGSGQIERAGWELWCCESVDEVYHALVAIGERLGLTPAVRRLDFSRVEDFCAAAQWDTARDTLEALQAAITPEHPDWEACEAWRKRLRKARREAEKQGGTKSPPSPHVVSRLSVGRLLQADAARLPGSPLPPHNFLGLFTPIQLQTPGAVDAVWVANVTADRTHSWTATAKGHPTAQQEGEGPAWELLNTDGLLLASLLQQLGDRLTLVWDADQVIPLLEQWHRQTTGRPWPAPLRLVDLRALLLVAFPTARRTDRPESLCDELGLQYRDALGLGGSLAAQTALLQACADRLRGLPDPLRAALREVLRLTPLPTLWLDALLPTSPSTGFVAYMADLEAHFAALPLPLQASQGDSEPSALPLAVFFGATGYLAQEFGPAYRPRGGQEDFAQYVDAALNSPTPYLLEAGTGIGKTIGYLIPLLLRGRRSYVATHTKNLQEQAWSKDVPTVLKALARAGIGRQVAILKGKGNYVCLQSVVDWLESPREVIANPAAAWTFAGLLHWLLQTSTGWLSEIEGLGNPELLAQLARDQAPPELRASWEQIDPHARARQAAAEADLVLVNHSFVVALAQRQTPDQVDVDTLLFDEAHNLEDVVTEALTLDFTPWALRHELTSLIQRDTQGRAHGLLRILLHHPAAESNATLRTFREAVLALEQALDGWCAQTRQRLAQTCAGEGDFDPDQPVLFPLSEFWTPELWSAAGDLAERISALSVAIEAVLGQLSSWSNLPRRLGGSLGALQQHLEENLAALNNLLTPEAEELVQWAEARLRLDEQGLPLFSANTVEWWAVFHSTPLDVATWLHDTLPPLYPHRLYVSATLTVGGEFTSLQRRLGLVLPPEQDPLPVTGIFPSPFRYHEQVLLAIPDDTPTPRSSTDPYYLETISRSIATLVRATGGRALVLFTSRKAMRQVQIRLQDELAPEGIIILTQSATNRAAIIERFKAAPETGERLVLLGLRAFWEGVDVPGAALTLLVITRLPFDHFMHPVAQARQRHYQAQHFDADYFREVVVPATFLHLRQMYGRLIRREDDRGICVLLDPRVVQKPYGRLLLSQLPGGQQAIAQHTALVLECIQRFLRQEPLPDLQRPPLSGITQNLSPEQLAIVESPAKRILVRAAAGSGKTAVLIARIVRAIRQDWARPGEVLALTFTNKAQGVMLDRLYQELGGPAHDLERNVLTYHKFAARIIRQADQASGTETKFLDEDNPQLQAQLLAEARRQAGLTERDLPDEDALTVIAYAQNGLVNEAELAAELPHLQKTDPFSAQLGRFFLAYVQQLRARGLLDYGEAIVRAVRILREDPETAERWSGRFKWIFCDEYQDTNPAQASLLWLIGQQAHLFVVGDSAQSIYSWQGADPDNLRRFEQDFLNTTPLVLSLNYRCFPNLVQVATHFLEQCGQSQGIPITYDAKRSNDRQSVYYLRHEDDVAEAQAIVTLIKSALAIEIPVDDEHTRPATVGVLARKWGLLQVLEAELIRQEIPYKFEGETARGLLADASIKQIVGRAVELVQRAASTQELGDTPESRVLAELRAGKINSASELLERARQILGRPPMDVHHFSDYQQVCTLLADKPVSTLVSLAAVPEPANPVVLSTVHSQKGEEFDTVFVIGLEKGNSPHEPPRSQARLLEWRRIVQRLSAASWRRTLGDDEMQRLYEQEEERIFYVAMTRARHNLVVCYANQRNRKPFARSEFLAQAYVRQAVKEVNTAYEVQIVEPGSPDANGAYHPETLIYQTRAGFWVRSKSELALANEFTQQGMYFEYEHPLPGLTQALPDFVFPDYGDIVLEHLGLLADADYQKRWAAKSRLYETQEITYFCTTEADIHTVSATVERLQEQFKEWVAQHYGPERVQQIEVLEQLRQSRPELHIERALGEFAGGLFEAHSEHDDRIVAIKVTWGDDEPDLSEVVMAGYSQCQWSPENIPGRVVWIGRLP